MRLSKWFACRPRTLARTPSHWLRMEILEERAVPAAFTAGNLVMYRVGVEGVGLSSAATAVFLDEYTTAGKFVQSISIPKQASELTGANRILTNSGSATSEGLLSLSGDGQYLLFAGYDSQAGNSSPHETLTSGGGAVLRVIGRASVDGTVDTSTTTTSFSGANIRSATSSTGTNIWISGENTGIVHTTLGGSGAGTVVSDDSLNNRALGIYRNQLYATSATNGFDEEFKGVNRVGDGLPTSAAPNGMERLPGLSDTSNPSNYGFYFADLSASVPGVDTLYVADDKTGVSKFSFDGTTWNSKGTVAGNARGLTGEVSGSTVTLYTMRTTGGQVQRLLDSSGYDGTLSGTPTNLFVAPVSTAFRGIAFAPQTAPPPDVTDPVVLNVSSTSADGAFKAGATLQITVEFDETVEVTGTPQITLETGTTDQVLNYLSGSGSKSLVFEYVVQPGDMSSDLDYVVASLTLNGGSIQDEAGNDADLTTLPAPGATGSLGDNKDIVIDTTTESVVSVSGASGTYILDDAIGFTIEFDDVVLVTGTPTLELNTGTGNAFAAYTGGSGSKSLTFTYTVQAGDESLDLDYVAVSSLELNGGTIADAAGNNADLALAAPGAAGSLGDNSDIVVDGIAPYVTGISVYGDVITKATALTFEIQFSEPNAIPGLDPADFQLVLNGVTGTIDAVTYTGFVSAYTITVIDISGNGTIRLDFTDNDSVTDLNGNPIRAFNGDADGSFIGTEVTIDQTPPQIATFTRDDASPTAAGDVSYTITFTSDVTGFSLADLSVFSTTGATITGFTPNSGSSYTITIDTGTGSGIVRLDLNDDDSIIDAATNPLNGVGSATIEGPVYDIDRTAPTVTSIVRAGLNPTNAGTVDFTVTFSEAVTGVGAADFTLAGIGSAFIVGVSADTGNTRTVTVNTGTGDGTIRLDALDDDSIVDGVGNKMAGGFTTGEAYTIDKSPPSVSNIVRAGLNPTNADEVSFTVTFSEAVTGVDVADFTIAGIGSAFIVSVSPDTGSTRTVVVNTGSGDGTVGLDLVDDDSIIDAATNKLDGGFIGEVYDIDKSVPAVLSITRADANPTNAAEVGFLVVFSEAVDFVDDGDFKLAFTSVAGASITDVSGSGDTWTVTVDTGAGDGTLGLDLVDDDSILDAAGNSLGGTGLVNGDFTGDAYDIDKTAPTVLSIVRNGAQLRNSGPVQFDVTFSEPMYGVDLADFALAATGLTGFSFDSILGTDGNTTYSVFANIGTGEGTLGLDFVSGATDEAGNPVAAGLTGEAFDIDTVSPTIVSITRLDADPTREDFVDFEVLFSEPVDNLTLSDFTLFSTGVLGAALDELVPGTGASRIVTVFTGTGSGTVRIDFADADTVTDIVGNVYGGAGTQDHTGDQFYTIDRVQPSILSIVRADGNPASTPTVQFTVTFDDAMTGVDETDFDLTTTGVSLAGVATVSGSGATWTVTVNTGTGDGTIQLNLLNNGSIADVAGNLLAGGTFNGETYDIDKSVPTAVVTLIGGPITTTQPIAFTVVFSEPITLPFGPANLTLGGTADRSNIAINTNNPNGDRMTWDVVIDDLGSDGTLEVSVAAAAVTDDAGNGNLVSNTATVLFDATAPSVIRIAPNGPVESNQQSVQFFVRFSEEVSGLDLDPAGGFDNFTLQMFGGIQGASITSVSQSLINPHFYLVDVDTGSFDGTLQLDLTSVGGIVDVANNPLTATHTGDDLFYVDKTAPNSGFSAVFPDPRTTPLDSIDLSFDEYVYNLTSLSDFSLTRDGNPVSLSGATLIDYFIGTVFTIDGLASATADDGVYVLTFHAATSPVTDAAGNPVASDAVVSFTVDATAPTVIAITEPTSGPTNAATLTFEVEFSEPVNTVDLFGFDGFDNFSLNIAGTLPFAAITDVIQTGANTYEVTVSPGAGVGTIQLVLKDSPALADLAGNVLANVPATSGIVTVDSVAPIISIDDGDADDIVPVGAVLTYTIDVTDDHAAAFSLAAADLSNAGSATISFGTISSNAIPGGQRYTVPVTATNAGTIVLQIASPASFQDAAGNFATLPQSDDATVTVDGVSPSVTVNPTSGQSLTNQQPVRFTILFSEAVTGFTSDEAVLSGTAGGIATAIKTVTPAGDGRTFFVEVSGLTSDGTVRIDVAAGVAADAAGNLNTAGTGANVITLDQTAPTVTSILRSNPTASSTNAASVVFEVNFSEAVTGVDDADFALAAPGLTGSSIVSASGSGTQWFVTVNAGSGEGTLRLDLVNDDSIIDAATNPLAASFTAGQSYTVDRVAPTVTGIALLDPTITNLTSVRFRVSFSEPVQVSTVSGADFTPVASGVTFSGVSVSPLGGGATAAQFDVTVSGVAGDGTLGLNVDAGTATILDAIGNALATGFSGPSYTIDQIAPTVSVDPASGQSFTNQQPVLFTVLFSEPVNDFTFDEAVLTGTAGGIGSAIKLVTNPSGDNRTFLVSVSGLTSDGTLRIDVAAGVASDDAGNLNAEATGANVVTYDVTPPVVTSIVRSNPSAAFTNASTVQFAVNFSEAVTGVDASDFSLAASGLSGTGIASVSGSGTQWFVSVTTGSGDGTLRLDVLDNDSIRDLATNRLGGSGTGNGNFTAGQSYTVDRIQPSIANITRLDPAVSNQSSLRFRVSFSEPVLVSTVAGSDFAPAASGVTFTGVTATPVTGGTTDSSFDVIVNGVSGNGTLRLDVSGSSATIQDAAGNALALSFTGPTYTVDQIAPTVTVNQAGSQLDPASSLPVRYLITFTEAVSGFTASMITRTGTSSGGTISIANPSSDNRTFEATVNGITGDGTVTLAVNAGVLADGAGNPNAASTFTDNTVLFDSTPPAVSVPDLDAAADSGSSATDNITNVIQPGFSGTAEAGSTVSLMLGSTVLGTSTATGGTWTITPGTAFVDGTYNVFARAVDAAGNVANSSTLTVVIDTVGPTVAVTRAAGQAATANASAPSFTAQFAVTFNQSVAGLNASQLTVGGTAGGMIANVSGTGANYTVTVGGLSNPGTVTVNVNAGVGADAAGNTSAASPAGEQVTVAFTTQTQLQITPATIVPGGTATATATVSAPAGSIPTGSITFAFTGPGGVINRSVNLAAGVATTDFTNLAEGSYSISATFIPAGGYLTSNDADNFTVEEPFVPPPVDQNSVGDYAGVAGRTVTVFNASGTQRPGFLPFTATEAPGGVRVAVADVNGDGVSDLIAVTGPGSPALMRVFNGKTNAQIYQNSLFEGFTGGAFVSAGDLNGDGNADVVVTPDQGGGPRVTIFNGPDGGVIANFFGIDDDSFRGGARTAIGDLNGDGTNDLLVAAGFGGGPRIAGIDGKSLGGTRTKLFADFFLFEETLRNGAYVTIGDLNGDGFGDILGGGGPGGGPRVLAIDGKSLVQGNVQAPIANFFAGNDTLRGGVRVVAKDLDGDNRADLVTGSGDTDDLFVFFGSSLAAGSATPGRTVKLPGILDGVYVG